MPDICSCGAELPPDARFCHKCGKPQRDEAALLADATEPETPVIWPTPYSPLPQPVPPAAAIQIPSFRNPIALRAALPAAAIATLLTLFVIYGFVIWQVAAGFASVYLFSRRTGQLLTVRAGARMGWITGVVTSFFVAVLFALSLATLASRSGGLAAFYREQLRNMPTQDPNLEQSLRLFESVGGQIMFFVLGVAIVFTVVTLFCMAGGALGAKVLAKD